MTSNRFQTLLFFLGCLLALVGGYAGLQDIGQIRSRAADASLDLYTRLAPFEGDRDMGEMMVMVDVDEESLKALGQWPWPRAVMAELLERVNAAQPLVIGVDILMIEEDRFSPKNIASFAGLDAATLSRIPNGDNMLGLSLDALPVVMATNIVTFETDTPAFAPVGVATIGNRIETLIDAPGIQSPIVPLQSAPGGGFVSLGLERDNNVRRVPLIARHNGEIIPSFALEMLRVAQGANTHVVRLAGDTGRATTQIKTGSLIVTGDDSGLITLHHGYSKRFKRVSAATIMANDDGEGWALPINNSFVVVGSSAAGLKDIHATSLESSLPGPLIHLQILHQILSDRVINAGEIVALIEIAAAVLIAIILALMMTKLTLVYAILLLGGGTAGATWGYLRAFLEADFLGNIFFSVGLCLGVSLLVLSFRAAWEETRRRQLKTAFNQYLSPEMVRRIDMSGSGPSLGGQTIPVSVMFMDIRGFTSLSEALSDDPQHLTKIINTIMERTTTIVLEHGGTLDKYIGDALMAFWNAPMPQEDHAARAVAAARAIEAAMPDINEEVKAMLGDRWSGDNICIGIGIATGEAVVGNLGSRFRFNYSCIGDTVNLAARLEPFSKNTGLATTLSAATAEGAEHQGLIPIDSINVRGKSQKTVIYSPLELDDESNQIHHQMLEKRAEGNRRGMMALLRRLENTIAYPASLISYYRED